MSQSLPRPRRLRLENFYQIVCLRIIKGTLTCFHGMQAECRIGEKLRPPAKAEGPDFCLDLAGAGGFEPPTTGFGDQRSDQTELRSCVGTLEVSVFGLGNTKKGQLNAVYTNGRCGNQ